MPKRETAGTAGQQPKTRRAIIDRLTMIAPYPDMGTPDQARAVARYLTVSVQRRWTSALDMRGTTDWRSDEYRLTVQAMLSEFAALHLLMRLRETHPELAEDVAVQIRDAWDDAVGVGEWLWTHGEALGLDLNEVSRLETALHEEPPNHPARTRAGNPR